MFIAQASSTDLVGSYLPALVVVFGAPLGLWLWLRRGRTGRQQRRLQINDKVALGKNQWAAVLTVDDRRFLVGAGESGLGLLSELEPVALTDTVALAETVSLAETEEVTTEDTDTSSAPIHAHEQPRMGFVKRLQHMTVRRPHTHRRPFSAARR